mmetsp:Transcript_26345/g.41340  ORF Transcript_26345/g.41340 Transcript_26345/m.41340 type:complete len:380 (-) Transcript_26345:643-1782(-)
MKAFPLLQLIILLFACHCVCAQPAGYEQDFNGTRFAMSEKLKFDNTSAKPSSFGVNVTALHLCQAKIERMKDEFNAELDELEDKLKKKEKQAQSAEDRAREARRKLTEAESELKYMHTQARSTYVNTTLMKEDAVKSVRKRVSRSWRNWENHYHRRLVPRVRRFRQFYHTELRRQQPNIASLKRKIFILIKKVESRWIKSTLLRPFVHRTLEAASEKVYARVEPSLKIAQEAVYLSAVSTIEEFSRAGITYLDALEEKQKGNARRDQERLLERRRHVIKDRHDRPKGRKARKAADSDDFDFTASLLQRKVKVTLEYALRDSKRIAKRCSALLPLALSLLLTRTFLLGSLLLFLGFPTSLIWFICVVNLVRLVKRFSLLR